MRGAWHRALMLVAKARGACGPFHRRACCAKAARSSVVDADAADTLAASPPSLPTAPLSLSTPPRPPSPSPSALPPSPPLVELLARLSREVYIAYRTARCRCASEEEGVAQELPEPPLQPMVVVVVSAPPPVLPPPLPLPQPLPAGALLMARQTALRACSWLRMLAALVAHPKRPRRS